MGVTVGSNTRKSIGDLPRMNIDNFQDQENATVDVAAAKVSLQAKKSRSKSIGPGGLDALREDAGNKRRVVLVKPKSILKPSIPLSPLRPIPDRSTLLTGKKPASPAKSSGRASVVPSATGAVISAPASPSKSPKRSQQAQPVEQPRDTTSGYGSATILHDDEQRIKHEKQKEEIVKQRDARRKSLANRRVSFAPEATLHTWNELDVHDATTSSASTDATRRASSFTSASTISSSYSASGNGSLALLDHAKDIFPNSPLSPRNIPRASNSSTNVRSPHRRLFAELDLDYSTSQVEFKAGSNHKKGQDSPSNLYQGDRSMEENLSTSSSHDNDSKPGIAYTRNNSSNYESATDPHNNAPEAMQTDTADDTEEDVSMQLAASEVTEAFQQWIQGNKKMPERFSHASAVLDQENVNPFSPAFKAGALFSWPASPAASTTDEDHEMSMDMTSAVGGIVRSSAQVHYVEQQKGTSPGQSRRPPSNEQTLSASSAVVRPMLESTDLVSGIQETPLRLDEDQLDADEDLSMELTAVIGGLKGNMRMVAAPEVLCHIDEFDSTMSLDSTVLSASRNIATREQTTQDMELTMGVGRILDSSRAVQDKTEDALHIAEATTMLQQDLSRTSPDSRKIRRRRHSTSASAAGSPSLAVPRLRSRRRQSEVEEATPDHMEHVENAGVDTTPRKKRVASRGRSPKQRDKTIENDESGQLARAHGKQIEGSPPATPNISRVDRTNEHDLIEPVLAPTPGTHRRSLRINREEEGLGTLQDITTLSKHVLAPADTACLSPKPVRARSIQFDGSSVDMDAAGGRMETSTDENRQYTMNDKSFVDTAENNITVNLKEKIGNLTPKKNNFRRRKSVAVGAAKGILGKRPLELDDGDDLSPDRARGWEADSPVKKIKLQAPPTKLETTGRETTSVRRDIDLDLGSDKTVTADAVSPGKAFRGNALKKSLKGVNLQLSPKRDVGAPTHIPDGESGLIEADRRHDKIKLEDFLKLTNIRFMELTTTKRRHTAAQTREVPTADADNGEEDACTPFERSVVAGACTVPLLELYQHSCRELKRYISEGRNIVHEIEVETFEENPPLFQEYLSASPRDRLAMANQFKNMKTHARLLSKGMWYEWRSKLLVGLKEGLLNIAAGFDEDSRVLSDKESAISSVSSTVHEMHTKLKQDCERLQKKVIEMAEYDQEELREARDRIVTAEEAIAKKQQEIEDCQRALQDLSESEERIHESELDCLKVTNEARQIQESCRRRPRMEMKTLRDKVHALVTESSWTITGIDSMHLTMVYRHELRLSIPLSTFQSGCLLTQQADPAEPGLSLSYVDNSTEQRHSEPLSCEKEFFLQVMRRQLGTLSRSGAHISDVLHLLSAYWCQALEAEAKTGRLRLRHIITTQITSNDKLVLKVPILCKLQEAKVNVTLGLHTQTSGSNVVVQVTPRAELIYGELAESQLNARLKDLVKDSGTRWDIALSALERELASQAKSERSRA